MDRLDTESREPRRMPPADALGTALWLAGRGLWPVPITPPDDPLSPNPGKAPLRRGWGARRLSTRALFAIFGRHTGAGVGIALGPAAGVVDLEVDDRVRAAPLLAELFPEGPPMTMGWNSSRGEHRLFLWDDGLGRAGSAVVHLADGALKFRLGSGGKQVGAVCPPSPGADGRPRRWNGVWEIAPCPEVLIVAVARMADAQSSRGRAERVPGRRPAGRSKGHALVVLEREASRVRTARPGTRNSTLNLVAFRLGQLIGTRALDRTAVEIALTGAALAAGLGEREVERTIRSGLEAGLSRPRSLGGVVEVESSRARATHDAS
jgi:hypothetical protein